MALASSTALGLALPAPRARVVGLPGDGSLSLTMGRLATPGRYRPRNLTHVILDNGSLLSTGGFVSHTGAGAADLAAIARGSGCPQVIEAGTLHQFMEGVALAFADEVMTTIVARVEAHGPDHFGMDLHLPENTFRFRRFVLDESRASGD